MKLTGSLLNNLLVVLKRYSIYVAFILFFIYLSISSEHFLSLGNMLTILRQVSVTGILAVGLTPILIQGDIDLSFGSLVTICGLCVAMFQGASTIEGSIMNFPVIVALILTVLVGVVGQAVNGLIITKLKVNPFILTLGTMTILKGFALVMSGGQSLSGLNPNFVLLSIVNFLGLPVIFWIFIIMAALSTIILRKTTTGRHIYSIGGNVQASFISGVPIDRRRITSYLIMGAYTAIAAIILTSRLNSATPLAGDLYLMDVIAACVIGGTSLSGGKGGIGGTILGVVFLGVINNGLNLLGVPSAFQYVAKGFIIVIAVIIDASKIKEEGRYIKQ
mgnify:CR=1 FL=1